MPHNTWYAGLVKGCALRLFPICCCLFFKGSGSSPTAFAFALAFGVSWGGVKVKTVGSGPSSELVHHLFCKSNLGGAVSAVASVLSDSRECAARSAGALS